MRHGLEPDQGSKPPLVSYSHPGHGTSGEIHTVDAALSSGGLQNMIARTVVRIDRNPT